MSAPLKQILFVAFALFIAQAASAADDTLAATFQNPPDSAKPHTWWHWMNGNVTREGITADLEAMKSAGIGGAQLFHVGERIPAGPVGYMTPQWRELMTHSVKEAGRLGIELCIHNCPGWSSSAGPWIKPEHAMQVIAWSDKKVHGPVHLHEKLPQPKAPQVTKAVDYYRDIAVLAYPAPTGGDVAAPIKQILGKTGVTRQNLPDPEIDTTSPITGIPMESIVVLTEKMDPTGKLTWEVPAGDWVILRIGHTPTGAKNKAAPPEGSGLEVDKLSREALDVHWNGMMAKVIEDIGPLAGKVLNSALIDSYEVGNQNWTPKFREEFQKRRGYDMLKFFPVITGRTVDSNEVSERFLWDLRRTIADLFADNYFGYFRGLCHKHGMQFTTEPYGNGGFDNLQVGGMAEVPMGEFWVGGHYMKSTKLASSAAHTNARKYVTAESFTASLAGGRYTVEPYSVKTLGDLAWCNGINRYVFHRYAHQPWLDLTPGMTMGKWGMHLERTITWWNEAAEWFRYIARSQYLLQEGRFVADALYFYGEGAPNDMPQRHELHPSLPDGYDYDGCDATVLRKLAVKDGRLVLPDGMSYRVLILPNSKYVTPHLAEKIRELVRAGATVVGPKPEQSPSLAGYPDCDKAVEQIADEVWGKVDGSAMTEHAVGVGRVVWGKPMETIFRELKAARDFEYRAISPHAKLAYIHRQIDDTDVYFISNQLYSNVHADCTFRVAGRAPEFWRPDTGAREDAPVYREADGRTVVPLRLGPAESVFVVFRKPARTAHLSELVYVPTDASSRVTTPKIMVRKATYETTDGLKSADVTKKVQDWVAEGVYGISATTEFLADLPRAAVKQLRVDYEVDGKPMTQTVGERAVMFLTDITRAATAPTYEVATSTTGGATLAAWQPGRVEYRIGNGTTQTAEVKEPANVIQIANPWTVKFQPQRGAPDAVQMQQLVSWPEHPDQGVKYFSGTATYTTTFEVPAEAIAADRACMLDLGVVKNFATVKLNGKDLGVLWKPPFRINIAEAVMPGVNHLEVRVTNLWPNRLIGDEQLPADADWKDDSLTTLPQWLVEKKPRTSGRVAFSTWRFYSKDSPLLESGLIGPVTVNSAKQILLAPK